MAAKNIRAIALAAGFAVVMLLSAPASAHCDGLDGPVVTAARRALETSNANLVLVWVQPADEAALRMAFEEAITVRRLGPRAREMADRYFFETVVRLHRAGEGAPYVGLQPAGRDLGPAIPLADGAVESGSAMQLTSFLAEEMAEGIRARFDALQRARDFAPNDVAGGRAYIARYVSFIHYVEGIHAALRNSAEGHYLSEAEVGDHH